MRGQLNLAFVGLILLLGTVLANQQPNQQDMAALHKNRRIAVVNELIKAQEQIQKALKKMYKAVSPAGGEHGSGEGDDCSDESKEPKPTSGEEAAYAEMKQKQIQETRKHINEYTHQLASSMLSMDKTIEKIDHKVDKEIKDSKKVVNYTLFYNKPARPHHGHHHHYSEEHSVEHGIKRSTRTSRQLVNPAEEAATKKDQQNAEVTNEQQVVKTAPEVNVFDKTQ